MGGRGATESKTVRLFSDFVCPFCFVAERSSLARLQNEFDLEVDWRGFELHPETPPGGVRLADYFPGAQAARMREFMRGFAARFGVREMGSPDHLPNTRRALAMSEFARDEGRLEAFREAAMRAHWQEGGDLEDAADLRGIARAAGLDEAAALSAASDRRYLDRVAGRREEAQRMGVTGVPTFFFGDVPVVGCQPYETLAAAARQAGATPRTR